MKRMQKIPGIQILFIDESTVKRLSNPCVRALQSNRCNGLETRKKSVFLLQPVVDDHLNLQSFG